MANVCLRILQKVMHQKKSMEMYMKAHRLLRSIQTTAVNTNKVSDNLMENYLCWSRLISLNIKYTNLFLSQFHSNEFRIKKERYSLKLYYFVIIIILWLFYCMSIEIRILPILLLKVTEELQ